MTICGMDGFDHYDDATEMMRKGWDLASLPNYTVVSATALRGSGKAIKLGRYAGSGLQTFYVFQYYPANYAGLYAGAAALYDTASMTVCPIAIEFRDGTTAQVGVYLIDNVLYVKKNGVGGSTINSVAFVWPVNVVHHLAFQATINDSTGSYEIWVDGYSVLSGSGANTRQSANNYANRVYFATYGQASGPTTTYDDSYWGTTSGTYNTTCPGDILIETIFPDGAGTYSAWTPSGAASNYQCADETNPDDDTTYVSTSTDGNKDSYSFGDLSAASATIYATQEAIYARDDDASAIRQFEPLARVNSNDYYGDIKSTADTYAFYKQIWEVNPDDTAAWDVADVNGAEFGMRLQQRDINVSDGIATVGESATVTEV